MTARLERFQPDTITVGDRLRARVDPGAVDRLAESISRIGLQTPITVRWMTDAEGGDDVVLVAGLHRLEAVKQLGIEFVECAVLEGTEAEAQMWEIAENLHRAELTALERDEHIAKWIKLADPAANASQLATHKKRGQQPGGINAASRELGIDKDDAHRAVKVAALAPEAKAAACATGLDDNRSALLRAAGEPSPEAQLAAVKREAEKAEARDRNRTADREIAADQADEFAQWLIEHIRPSEMPVLISWIEGTKPKQVIAALRRRA